MEIINSVVGMVEKILIVVNSTKKVFILCSLLLMTGTSYLGYKLIQSDLIVESLSRSKIERVGGNWCYQRKRSGTESREIGIQFPLSTELQNLHVEQNLSGFVVSKEPTITEFNTLCEKLVQEVLSTERQEFLLKHYPESRQKLIDYFKRLEKLNSGTGTAPIVEPS